MASLIRAIFGDRAGALRQRILGVYALLVAFNVAAWVWAFYAFHTRPLLLGTCLLAYSFGLRHAVDADHIAAIDNVTRKLMQAGKRPLTVGLMFSLGHSTIVVLASLAIAASAFALQGGMAVFREWGSVIGTIVSTVFLVIIAAVNLVVFRSLWQTFRSVRRGQPYRDDDVDLLLSGRGLLARLFRPLFRLVNKSWHMYFLGFLFGLGFDTATEVGLLGISAASATQGMSAWSILVFPALFTAGMTLVDTTDGILMIGAYRWAFVNPLRKLYYNMTITAVSIVVALLVGLVEGLGLIGDRLHVEGVFWDTIGSLNDHFGVIGFAIVGIFMLSWGVSAAIAAYRVR